MSLSQIYNQPVSNLIKARSSWRTFDGKELTHEEISALADFLAAEYVGPFGNQATFKLIAARDGDSEMLRGLGTYGFIKGAKAYIVGAVENTSYSLEDYGFLLETVILYATQLGLQTCWLGGSFDKSAFAERYNLEKDNIIPAITPVGHAVDRRRLMDKMIRAGAGSSARKPFESLFFMNQFGIPLEHERADRFRTALDMLRLAPSASNKQPWRVIADFRSNDHDIFHFFLTRTPGYYKEDGGLFKIADLQRVDMGIGFSHFELTCKDDGIQGEWKIIPDELPVFEPGNRPDNTTYVASYITANQSDRR